MAISSHHTTNWFEVMNERSEHQQNFKSRVLFQLGNFVVIVRIPWGSLNGDRKVALNALSTQCMTHPLRFRSLTRRWEPLSGSVQKLEPFCPKKLMRSQYNRGTDSKDDNIFCVCNIATVRRLNYRRGQLDRAHWPIRVILSNNKNSSENSLKRASSQRSVTSSHAWAQDLELKEDSENDVLNCPNPALLRLHNTLVVRSKMKVLIVNLIHWPQSKKRIDSRTNSFSYKNESRTVYLKQGDEISKPRVMLGWVQLPRTTCP